MRKTVAVAAAVLVLGLAAVLWWQWEQDRPWPLLLWTAVKGLLWSKGLLKLAVAIGLGAVIAVRGVARRVRRTPDDAASG